MPLTDTDVKKLDLIELHAEILWQISQTQEKLDNRSAALSTCHDALARIRAATRTQHALDVWRERSKTIEAGCKALIEAHAL